MLISEVLSREIERLSSHAVVLEAAQMMRDHNVGFVSVVDGERLVGVVTDRDIVLRCVAGRREASTTPVEEIMSMEVVCCFADDSVEHAQQMMAEHNVPRLPVIDRAHHLLGLVTRPELEGSHQPRKTAVKVTFHKQKTDSSGHAHKVAVKTVYITGMRAGEEAKAAAIRHLEEETGTSWQSVATGMDTEQEPSAVGERSK